MLAIRVPIPNKHTYSYAVQMNLNLCKWADFSHAAATKSAQAQVISSRSKPKKKMGEQIKINKETISKMKRKRIK